MPHDGCYATRTRQGIAHINREGRAYSPQIIIRRALKQEVLQILNIATRACSSQHSHLTYMPRDIDFLPWVGFTCLTVNLLCVSWAEPWLLVPCAVLLAVLSSVFAEHDEDDG
jgi:hypothetical protein